MDQDTLQLLVKEPLTDRERRIASLVVKGHKNSEIAAILGHTSDGEQKVKTQLRLMYAKLGVEDRLGLALKCVHDRSLWS